MTKKALPKTGGEAGNVLGSVGWVGILVAILIVGAALWGSIQYSKRAKSKASVSSSLKANWYPQPAFLLQHDTELALSPRQRRHVQIVAREWSMKKAAYDAQFKTFNRTSEKALEDIKSGQASGGDYGKLLKEFDKSREDAWKNATETLAGEQVLKLNEIRVAEQKAAARR
jgi:hypothetical protein